MTIVAQQQKVSREWSISSTYVGLGSAKNQPNTKCGNFKCRRRKSRLKRAKIGVPNSGFAICSVEDLKWTGPASISCATRTTLKAWVAKKGCILGMVASKKRRKSTLYWKILFNRWGNIYQRWYFQFRQHQCFVRREFPCNSTNALSGFFQCQYVLACMVGNHLTTAYLRFLNTLGNLLEDVCTTRYSPWYVVPPRWGSCSWRACVV